MERLGRVKENVNKIFYDTRLFLPHRVLQTFVEEHSRCKNVDPVSFLSHLLPVVSHLMSGKKTEIVFHETWKEQPILFHILIASKSSSKTPVMNVLVKEVNKIEEEEMRRAKREHELEVEESDEDSPATAFNPLAYMRVFDSATGPGMLHALNAGTGNMLGMIDEMSTWSGLTDPQLKSDLLKAFSANKWGSLTVTHKNVVADSPYINISGNIQTELMVERLKQNDPVAMYCRYSLFAVRQKYCKRFSMNDQLKPLPEIVRRFDLKKLFQFIIDFHDRVKVEYHFSTQSFETMKEVISDINAMADASGDEDFQSVCSKSISKLIRAAGVQTALRIGMDQDAKAGVRRNGVLMVEIQVEDVIRAKRCVLYSLASYSALKDNPLRVHDENELDNTPGNESLLDDQPSLPKARKYRKKSADVPIPEMSTIADLLVPKVANNILKWYRSSDENDEVTLTQIRHNRWFVRNSQTPDDEMLNNLVQLVVSHGVVEMKETRIKFLRTSPSAIIESKIVILKKEIQGYLD